MTETTDDLHAGTITLDAPISFQNRTYETLQLREPTIGEVIRGDAAMRTGNTLENMHGREVAIISAVTGWPLPAVQKLPVSMHNRAWTFLQGFLSEGAPGTAEMI